MGKKGKKGDTFRTCDELRNKKLRGSMRNMEETAAPWEIKVKVQTLQNRRRLS